MDLIRLNTKWDSISEFLLVDNNGNFYSLNPEINNDIKQELLKYDNFDLGKWKTVTIDNNTYIGLQYGNELLQGDDNSLSDQTELINTIQNYPITQYFKEVKWDTINSFLSKLPEYDDDLVLVNSISPGFELLKSHLFNNSNLNYTGIPFNSNLFISTYKLDTEGYKTVTNYYKLLKKKSKAAYMRDLSISIRNDPYFLPYFILGLTNNEELNSYCCDNAYSQDCSVLYFDNSQIKSKLFYSTFYHNLKDDIDLTKPILRFGYLINPINNVTDLYPTIQTPPEIANIGVSLIVGYITFPINQTVHLKYITNATSVKLRIDGDEIPLVNGILSLQTYTNKQYKLEIKLINKTNSNPYITLMYSNDRVNWNVIPAEWYSAPYYFDIMKNYNEYLAAECDQNWDKPNCYNVIKNNNDYLIKLLPNILNVCANGTDLPVCQTLYNVDSINYDIKKSYCMGNNNFITNDKCNDFYSKNTDDDEIKQSLIRHCTNDKRVWNSAKCQEYIMEGSTWYPKNQEFYDAYCIDNHNFTTDYNTCLNNYSDSPNTINGKKFTDSVINYCKTEDMLFKTCIEDVDTPEYLNLSKEVKINKLAYCLGQPLLSASKDCSDYVIKNIANPIFKEEFDDILIKNCNTYPTTDPVCGLVMDPYYNNVSNIPKFNEHLVKTRCVDSSKKFIANDECKLRNVITNPAYSSLIQPTLNYCLDPANLNNDYCNNYNSLNMTYALSQPQTSGFRDRETYSVECDFDYRIIFIFIIFVLFYCICNKLYYGGNIVLSEL